MFFGLMRGSVNCGVACFYARVFLYECVCEYGLDVCFECMSVVGVFGLGCVVSFVFRVR